MEKEEILAKAQKENKGKDLVDLEAANKGTNLAFMIGGLTTVGIAVIEFIATKRFPYCPMFGIGIMLFVVFLYKYIKLRKKHELVMTIIYGIWMVIWAFLWIMQLLGRI